MTTNAAEAGEDQGTTSCVSPTATDGRRTRRPPPTEEGTINAIAAEARRLARRTRRMTLDEWAEYRAKYKRETHRDAEPPCLGPSSAFSDRKTTAAMRRRWRYEIPEAQTGRRSLAVTHRLALAGAGWRRPPGAAEFYDAVRATRRTARRACVIAAWLREATLLEWWYGIFEGVYSWRQLAEAVHVQRLGHYPNCDRLNGRSQV